MQRICPGSAVRADCAAPAVADPMEGVWKTEPDDDGKYGYVRVAPCGDKLCGTLVKAFRQDGGEDVSPNIGKKIIWDMVPQGDGAYGGGKVWAPDRDKIYASQDAAVGRRSCGRAAFWAG